MNKAIATARKTSDAFLQALRNPKSSYRDFCVKKPYPSKRSDAEHIWIGGVHEVGDHLEGRIENEPYGTTEVKFGQLVSVKLNEISDWRYLEDNRLIGGYTIRYFYDRMSQAEKKAFLEEAGFVME